jgi:hypothetical protein
VGRVRREQAPALRGNEDTRVRQGAVRCSVRRLHPSSVSPYPPYLRISVSPYLRRAGARSRRVLVPRSAAAPFLNPPIHTRKRSAVGDADRCRYAMSETLPSRSLRRGDSIRGGGSVKSPLFGASFPPFSSREEKGAAGGSLQGNDTQAVSCSKYGDEIIDKR